MDNNVATKLKDLNLINRFLFNEVMEDRESYQAAVSILLGEDIRLLTEPETEKEFRVSPELREIRLDDGALRVFINTKGRNKEDVPQEFLDFMEYLTNTTDKVTEKTESQRIKRIHEQVKRIKLSEKMGVKYMQLWEEKAYIWEEGMKQGLAQGEKRLINTICKKLLKGKSPEKIADEVEEDLNLIEKIRLIAQTEVPDYNCDKIYAILHKDDV